MHTALPQNQLWLNTSLAEPTFGADPEHLFYLRTADGRTQLIRQHLGTGLAEPLVADPAPRGTVGYGGAAYAARGDLLVFAAGGQLFALNIATGAQRSITPRYEGIAGPAISPCGRFVVAVIEQSGHADVILVDAAGEQLPVKLSDGPAFAANPTFAPDGVRVAWIEWAVDKMPWDESSLRLVSLAQPTAAAPLAAALLPVTATVLSSPGTSFGSPQWSPDGAQLAYTSDADGWRSLYLADTTGQNGTKVDVGVGEIGLPDWAQGQFAVRWGGGGRIYCVRRFRSVSTLLCIQADRSVRELPSTATSIGEVAVHAGATDLLAYTGSNATQPTALLTRAGDAETIRATTAVGMLDRTGLSAARVVEWPAADGTTVYGILYRALKGDGPRPLLVSIHGGPTSEVPLGWSAMAQYYAGRGWHVLSVNHRGGTGNGRAYQDLLNEQWGVVDVEDARSGAEQLIAQGMVDPRRVAITGGSAGGYTTLMALVRDPDFWAAGVSYYGIGNLYDLGLGSHRFEARYEDGLIGPLPATAERWIERSALTHVRQTRAPLLLFHGKEDTAVPYQQSVEFADAVKAQGGIAELVLYDDEGHGFRKEANRRDSYQRMEAFLERYVINLQGKR